MLISDSRPSKLCHVSWLLFIRASLHSGPFLLLPGVVPSRRGCRSRGSCQGVSDTRHGPGWRFLHCVLTGSKPMIEGMGSSLPWLCGCTFLMRVISGRLVVRSCHVCVCELGALGIAMYDISFTAGLLYTYDFLRCSIELSCLLSRPNCIARSVRIQLVRVYWLIQTLAPAFHIGKQHKH